MVTASAAGTSRSAAAAASAAAIRPLNLLAVLGHVLLEVRLDGTLAQEVRRAALLFDVQERTDSRVGVASVLLCPFVRVRPVRQAHHPDLLEPTGGAVHGALGGRLPGRVPVQGDHRAVSPGGTHRVQMGFGDRGAAGRQRHDVLLWVRPGQGQNVHRSLHQHRHSTGRDRGALLVQPEHALGFLEQRRFGGGQVFRGPALVEIFVRRSAGEPGHAPVGVAEADDDPVAHPVDEAAGAGLLGHSGVEQVLLAEALGAQVVGEVAPAVGRIADGEPLAQRVDLVAEAAAEVVERLGVCVELLGVVLAGRGGDLRDSGSGRRRRRARRSAGTGSCRVRGRTRSAIRHRRRR